MNNFQRFPFSIPLPCERSFYAPLSDGIKQWLEYGPFNEKMYFTDSNLT